MMALSGGTTGGGLDIMATLPMGAGLSSSAALCVALAEVLGDGGSAEEVALRCQAAEQLTGVPVGAMDPLVCAGAVAGHALLIDFSTLAHRPVPVPLGCELVVVDSGQRRTVRSSAYAAPGWPNARRRRRSSAPWAWPIDPTSPISGTIGSGGRARHVITECDRVRGVVEAFGDGDLETAGRLLTEGHRSLGVDFEVSTPVVDQLVTHLVGIPGVFGARMTGAGFGGCAVALCRPGAIGLERLGHPGLARTGLGRDGCPPGPAGRYRRRVTPVRSARPRAAGSRGGAVPRSVGPQPSVDDPLDDHRLAHVVDPADLVLAHDLQLEAPGTDDAPHQ